MLGEMIYDPDHVESDLDSIEGLGLLPVSTSMKPVKTTHQVTFNCDKVSFLGDGYTGSNLRGYEIHMGTTVPTDNYHDATQNNAPSKAFDITSRSEQPIEIEDGVVSAEGTVLGSYIHGLLDNDEFRRYVINGVRTLKGLAPLTIQFRYFEHKDQAYDRLANIVQEHLKMDEIYRLLEEK